MTDLFYQGHVYVDTGETPCPREGWEDGLVATQTEDGTPAWWQDGHLFVLDKDQSVDVPVFAKWAGVIKRTVAG